MFPEEEVLRKTTGESTFGMSDELLPSWTTGRVPTGSDLLSGPLGPVVVGRTDFRSGSGSPLGLGVPRTFGSDSEKGLEEVG